MSVDPFQSAHLHPLGEVLFNAPSELDNPQFLKSVYDAIAASVFVVDVLADGNFRYVAFNPTHEAWTGICATLLQGKTPEQIFSPVDAAIVRQQYAHCVQYGKTISYEECSPFQSTSTWWITTLTPLKNSHGQVYRLIGTSTNITERKQAEEALQLQADREQLLGAIALRIRQSLDLNTILNRTVMEVRQFLQTDRVLIYRFEADWSGVMAMESVQAPWQAILGANIKDPCFTQKHIERYRQGRVQVIEDIYATGLHPCHIALLAQFQVRANLVVPIVSNQQLWGLLIAQHCQAPRQWQQVDVDLLKQLGNQVGIAVQQAELHHQVQCCNIALAQQVQQRTAELQQRTTELEQALKFSALVQRITEKLRDSLDEQIILQTVTRELAQVLALERCKIDLYDRELTIATTAYEYTTTELLCQGHTKPMAEFLELYQQLLQGDPVQFFERVPVLNSQLPNVTRLACPIRDDQEILGNLWLFRPKAAVFHEAEIQLVQQVANACAIAIRQARLYQHSQTQVQELAKLDRLKAEFLKTLTHELRTPITSINLAAQTLQAVLEEEPDLVQAQNPLVTELLGILHQECQRETGLINDLLAFAYLDAEATPMLIDTVDLKTWLPAVMQPFESRLQSHNQQMYLILQADLPSLTTDLSDLERILIELLTNACKYTPPGELIIVSASVSAAGTQLSVRSTGVEIPPAEQRRIFDPFYRIPTPDPWQQGGIGLGLALVQKLVNRLGASIQVNSGAGQTTFTVEIPQEGLADWAGHCSDRVVVQPIHLTDPRPSPG